MFFCFIWLYLLGFPFLSFADTEGIFSLTSNKYRFTEVVHEKLDFIGGLWAIEQDRFGFMWFGGENGLARYDGHEIKIYRNEPSNIRSLSSSYVRDLLVDKSGHLWVATTLGLNLYVPETDDFTHYRHDPIDPYSISGDDVRTLEAGADGALWIGTGGAGLNQLNVKTQRFQHFIHDSTNTESIASNFIYDLKLDSSGVLWIGTVSKGLDKLVLTPALAGEPTKFVHFRTIGENPRSISSNDIRSIFQDRLGHIWIGTAKGLNRLSDENKGFDRFLNNRFNPKSISSDFVQDIAEDTEGNLWFATSGKGLNRYDIINNQFERYLHNPQDSSSLFNNNIRNLFSDRSGNFWLGHFASGVSMLDQYATAFKNYYHNPYVANTLNHNEITDVVENKNGDLWVGTVGGVNFLNRRDNTVYRFVHDPSDDSTISDGGVLAFLLDTKSRLWTGLWSSGINRIDSITGEITKYKADANNPYSLASNAVWAMLEDSTGRIWIGNHVGGLQYYDELENHFVSVATSGVNENVIPCDSVFALFEDSLSNLWVGCSNGLYLRRNNQQGFERFYHVEGDELSLSANHVWMINEDIQGNIWVGTQGGGVNRFNASDNSFMIYRTENGLSDDLVTGMLQDEKGYIWFSTGRGLSKFDPKLNTFKNYNKRYGMAGNVFNRAAYCKTKYNEFVFGSKDGLSIFNPKYMPQNQQVPNVKITDFKLFNKSVVIGGKASPLLQSILATKKIVLNYEQSSFSFHFSALSYRISSDNKYAYRLEGFDQGWHYVGGRRQAYYTNLDPGEYTFRVKAANNEGLWNEEGDSIHVIILPPWWLTWWAYLIYAVVMVTLFWLVVQVFWQRKVAESERRVSDQLRSFDKVKDNFLANTSHEIRTPLNGIIGLSESLRDGIAGDLPAEAQHYLAMVIVSGKRLSNLVNDILDFSKLRENKISLKKMPVDLYSLAEVVLTLFIPLLKGRPIEIINTIEADLPLILADENRLQQILYNLIGNAIKFTDEGRITLSTSIIDENIWVSISDTGIGISEDKYEKVFNSYEQIENDANYGDLGTGLGLTVTKQLVELHGGEIKLASVLGEGSCFSFSLPLSKADSSPLVKPLSSYEGEKANAERNLNLFAAPAHGDQQEHYRVTSTSGSDFHILVVDDEPVNRLVLEGFLRVKQYRITECVSGYEALDVLNSKHDISLVLLDVMMPRLSGFETCRKIRKKYTQNELPIIFLTGRNQRADLEAGYAVGGNDFLTKPVAKEELLSRVETHLLLADKMRRS